MIKPTGNVAPSLVKDHGTQEQAQMAAWWSELLCRQGSMRDQKFNAGCE
jgi:hypothetical protein